MTSVNAFVQQSAPAIGGAWTTSLATGKHKQKNNGVSTPGSETVCDW